MYYDFNKTFVSAYRYVIYRLCHIVCVCDMVLLIISTVICILNDIVPLLIKFILSRQYAHKKCDHELWDEISNLKREMTGISMVNEFAKYARLQRKYNNLESILKNNIKQRQNRRLTLQLSLTYAFYVINGILAIYLMYRYNNVLVIDLPKDTLWPIQDVLSWPAQHGNGISLMNWAIITKSGISSCRNLYK